MTATVDHQPDTLSTVTTVTASPYLDAVRRIGRDPRPGQQQLVEAGTALEPGQALLVKAPTATGKSLAALMIAGERHKAFGGRTVIATYTKLLQDQYARAAKDSDLAHAQELYPELSFAVLKGANNYLCRTRAPGQDPAYKSLRDSEGDPGELKDRPHLYRAKADSKSCGKHDAEHCGYAAAKDRARRAHCVITNHSLVLWDQEMRDPATGVGRILGDHDLLIVDEIHNFPRAAEDFATTEIDLREQQAEYAKAGNVDGALVASQVQQLLGPGDAFGDRLPTLQELQDIARMDKLQSAPEIYAWVAAAVAARRSNADPESLAVVARQPSYAGKARRVIKSTAIDIAPVAAAGLSTVDDLRAVLMMSATTGTPDHPTYVVDRCGVSDVQLLEVTSALDYPEQMQVSLLQAPQGWSWGQAVERLVTETDGRTLVLCRSWKRVSEIQSHLMKAALPFAVYVQDREYSGNNGGIVRQFKESTQSILVGTASFFEGIDVPGDSLSQVVITELPMLMDFDPIGKERKRRAGARYRDDVLTPSTALVMEQMMGRLIRRTDDRGLVVVLDPAAQYGWGQKATMHAVASFGCPVVSRRDALGWWSQ